MKILISVETTRVNRYFECSNLESVFRKILPDVSDLGSYIGCKKTDATVEDLFDFDYYITITQRGKYQFQIHIFNVAQSSMEVLVGIDYENYKIIIMKLQNVSYFTKLKTLFKVRFKNFVVEKEQKEVKEWKIEVKERRRNESE